MIAFSQQRGGRVLGLLKGSSSAAAATGIERRARRRSRVATEVADAATFPGDRRRLAALLGEARSHAGGLVGHRGGRCMEALKVPFSWFGGDVTALVGAKTGT